MNIRPIALFASLLFAALPVRAQAPAGPSPEGRLREQIKTLTTQLRTAQTESATLAADKATADAKIKKLEEATAELNKRLDAEKAAATKEADKLREELAGKTAELETTKALHVKAEQFGKASADRANKTEAERAKLAAQVNTLKPIVSDQRMKNGKMLEIAHEILTRYEKFGLGTALTAREPFVGITRARLETMVDDYDGRLAAQRIRLDGTSPKPVAGNAEPAATPAAKPKAGVKNAADRPSDGPRPAEKPAAAKP
jgi:hypothetical protein